jgi:hypothetical protein
MSKTLRRPMFRGGRVSSYGTGIAHGLADGGMPPKRGLVTGPGGYQGDWNWRGGSTGNVTTGGQIVDKAAKTLESRIARQGRNFLRWFRNPGTGITGAIGRSFPSTLRFGAHGLPVYGALKGSEAQLELIDKASEKGLLDEFGESVEFADGRILPSYEFAETVEPSEYTVKSRVLEEDPDTTVTGIQPPSQLTKPNIDTSLVDKKVLEIQNSDDAELSLEEIKEALGGKKARGRDVTDMLLRFAGAEGKDTMEKFQEFAKTEAAVGPSRTEKIDTAAATFMLKDKFQSKRDKANIEMMKTKIDYSVAAGKDISIAEGVLAATKGTNFSDKKLSTAIQVSTSATTGEKHKFKGVTDMAGLKAAMKSGDLTVGDTIIVKETVKIEGQPDKIIKKIIEIQLIDGKIRLEEIYRV